MGHVLLMFYSLAKKRTKKKLALLFFDRHTYLDVECLRDCETAFKEFSVCIIKSAYNNSAVCGYVSDGVSATTDVFLHFSVNH